MKIVTKDQGQTLVKDVAPGEIFSPQEGEYYMHVVVEFETIDYKMIDHVSDGGQRSRNKLLAVNLADGCIVGFAPDYRVRSVKAEVMVFLS